MSDGGFLSRHGNADSFRFIEPPGCDGPRGCLAFVLKALTGSDSGVIRHQISLALRVNRANPDAVQKVLDSRELMGIAESSMVNMMRELVDLWIDSGKSASDRGIDTPSERNVQDIPAGRTWSLFHRIDTEFFPMQPQWPEMKRNGTVAFRTPPPRFEGAWLEGIDWSDPLHHFGRQTAYYWFVKLLDSPFSRHIARCDACRSYFSYKRARKRTVKNGVFCSACKGTGSVKRTQTTRDKRKKENIDSAADVWEKWKPNSSHGLRPKWIAAQVRERSHQRIIFTGSWVTRHQEEIETEVNRRKNAKG
jgi:hypothetical protein